MKHKLYPKYKPSGIEWIGEIPDGWFKKRIKYISKVNSDALPEDTDEIFEFYYIDIGNVTLENGFSRGEKITFSEAPSRARRIVKEGDTIVSTVRTYLKAIAYIADSESELIASTGFAVVRPEVEIDRKYLYYSLCSERVIHTISAISVGVSYPAINASDLACIFLIFPNKAEQKKIADFLDQKTSQIDELIQKKEEMIKLLKEKRAAIINQAVTKGLDPNAKMKPSGIDWIGDIPEDWELYKLKYLTNKIGSGVTPKGGATVYENEGIPLLRSQNIHFDSLHLDDVAYISEKIHNSMKTTEVSEGDVLFNITGASIGRCNYWPEGFGIANVNQHVCIVRPSGQILTKYLYFSLYSDFIQQRVWVAQDGCSREGLNFADFGCFYIFVPEKDEQQRIVDFLEEKISEINGLIQKIQSAIEKLREYRSSLITAAVTGKIDVRGK